MNSMLDHPATVGTHRKSDPRSVSNKGNPATGLRQAGAQIDADPTRSHRPNSHRESPFNLRRRQEGLRRVLSFRPLAGKTRTPEAPTEAFAALRRNLVPEATAGALHGARSV
jgi:hypothetical protein